MSCNHIVLPGGILTRILRYIIRGKKLYQHLTVLNDHHNINGAPLEFSVGSMCNNQIVNNIFKPLEPFNDRLSVYLHGSWADNTTTNFSDIDDFIILEDGEISSSELKHIIYALNKVDMHFCRIDPIQHHGHWISCRSELRSYDNSFIPLFILKKAALLFGREQIQANINMEATISGLRSGIINTCKNIDMLGNKIVLGSISAYELKQLIGSFLLMPAYIFQLKGVELNKPEAIARAGELYSDTSIEMIKWCTECRLNWDYITSSKRYRLFSFLPFLVCNPHIWRMFSQRFSPKVNAMKLDQLSKIKIEKVQIDKFIAESESYAG